MTQWRGIPVGFYDTVRHTCFVCGQMRHDMVAEEVEVVSQDVV